MKIAVVGAGGLVGKEFTRQFSSKHRVLSLTHSNLDITDVRAVRRVFFAELPELVINCAVVGVDACELDPAAAWSVNVVGAANLATAAADIDAEFVQLSSNFVFDGKREPNSFYTVKDRPNPINVYGQTKLAGERAVIAASRRCFVVRTSWVFGVGKENFVSTVARSLHAAKKTRAITDVWANTTYVRDLVSRVVEILSRRHYSVYHVVNSGICSYYDFALAAGRTLKMSDFELGQLIEPAKLCDFQLRAKRPRYTPMHCAVSEEIALAPLQDWRAALAEYVRDDCGFQ
jgi:dTDP-4-dehydrorhamnose reductase